MVSSRGCRVVEIRLGRQLLPPRIIFAAPSGSGPRKAVTVGGRGPHAALTPGVRRRATGLGYPMPGGFAFIAALACADSDLLQRCQSETPRPAIGAIPRESSG